MTFLPRCSGLFGFLLILGAVAPSAALAASAADPASPAREASQTAPLADDSVEARLRRISAALAQQRQGQESADPAEATGRRAVDGKLAWVFVNGPGVGWRNGGFRNGGFYNGGWRNGGFYNGGFRNGGFYNGGFRNGGWRNYW